MLWQLLLVAAAISALYYRWSRRRLYLLAKQIPLCPGEYPIVGHAHMFFGSDEDRMNGIQKLGTRANNQGGLSSLWMANRLFICMSDPLSIEVVTRACLEKDYFLIKIVRTATGDGSIFGPVKIWHRRRKINSPFFSLKNLHRLLPMFNEKSLLMTKLMKVEAGGGHFSIWKYVTAFTFDAVGESAFGVSLNSQENQNQDILHAITYCTQKIAGRMMQPWLHTDLIYHVLPVYKEFQKCLKHGYNFIEEGMAMESIIYINFMMYRLQIIKNKRTELAKIGPNEIKNINKNEPNNFIHIAMQNPGGLEKCYSDLELREEALVMLVAGNDTSATGSSFTSVLLSRYQEVQDKVHQELKEVFGDSDRPVTAEDLLKLKYLEAVLKESLRLYPPVPIVVREVNNDTVLPCGTTLVEGSSILLNIWATHRNPAYWGEDADVFRPERFLEGPLKHPAQFIPFSYSIRNCLGATYAMLSMKVALANMLRRYRLLPPTGIEAADLTKPLPVSYELMMKAVDGWQLRVQEK